MKIRKGKKKIEGVGINDADYCVTKTGKVNGKRKIIWMCPFYRKWKSMIERCYSPKVRERQNTYVGCSVCEEWLKFSNFRAWMETQDWEDKHLDKDLLREGNKLYSAETCIFVSRGVNNFINERSARRGELPTGVYYLPDDNKYIAVCSSPEHGVIKSLGRYESLEEAHKVWLDFKRKQAYILAAEQSDERVANALINRYENYQIR